MRSKSTLISQPFLQYRTPAGGNSQLGDFGVELQPAFFRDSTFNFNTVNTKAFVLLLAMQEPLNFISGAPVQLQTALRESNRKEFHHLFPRKHLQAKGYAAAEINALVNFAVLGRAENNQLGGVAPSQYRAKMPLQLEIMSEILRRSLCPQNLFTDDFVDFAANRAQHLTDAAYGLMELRRPIN